MEKGYTYELKNNGGDVVVDVVVSHDKYHWFIDHVYEEIKDSVKVAGFRPGKAPRQAIEAKLGTKLVEETLTHMFTDLAVEIITDEKLIPLTKIDYKMGDFDGKGEIKFTFEFAAYPEVKLGDFTKIKVKREDAKVEATEIDEMLVKIFEPEYTAAQPKPEEGEGQEKPAADKDAVLAFITDEKIVALGVDGVTDMASLRAYIEKQLKNVKADQVEQDYQHSVLHEAVKLATFALPAKLLSSELDAKEADYRKRVSKLGIDLETFLTAQKTDLDKLREGWREQSEIRFGEELILSEIVRIHDLQPSDADVEAELKTITDSKLRSQYDSDNGRRYIHSVLVQQRGLRKLLELVNPKDAAEAAAA